MNVMCVAGARPNFMKIAPILREVERRGWNSSLVHTGQHYDSAMSDVFFEELQIRSPDYSLGVGSGSQAQQTARIISAFEPVLEAARPETVLVVGDVNSTMACALVAAKLPIEVAHVEAGLRSRDWSMPEEVNRIVTDAVSDVLLSPSQDAVDNLLAEGFEPSKIHLVGNVMADTLLHHLEVARERPVLDQLSLTNAEYALVTLHRPALVDDPAKLVAVLNALGRIGERVPVVWPVHPRTSEQITTPPRNVRLLDPLGYLDFLALQSHAALVLTDSGGVQEETTMLGVPCLTLRDNTERPITIEEGTNRIVGTNPRRIIEAALTTLERPPAPRRPALWDGNAAQRVVDALERQPSASE